MTDKEVKRQAQQVLDEKVRPYLNGHGGDIEIMGFQDGELRVHLVGECLNCPAAQDTYEAVVKKELLNQVEGITSVVLDDGITEDMLDFARRILNHEI